MKPRLLVCCGTRPELIKLKPVVDRMRVAAPDTPVLLLHTGQHTDLVDAQLDQWSACPIVRAEWLRTGDRDRSLAAMVHEVQGMIAMHPSITHVVVQGDTDSTLACALAAYRSGLRVIHVEAGLRTNDPLDPYPEEINRSAIASLAHLHFAPTQGAAENLHREGISAQRVLVTGNTSIDPIVERMHSEQKREFLRDLVLITLHRNGKDHGSINDLAATLNDVLVDHPLLRVHWITHPNRIGRPDRWPTAASFSFGDPLPHEAFLDLLDRAAVVITDSGGVQEEATALGIPVVVYRRKHERPESMVTGAPAICTFDGPTIRAFITQNAAHQPAPSQAFGDGCASHRIADRLRVDLGGEPFRVVIIGGGPAGTGPLFAAIQRNTLDAILAQGLAILERSDHLVVGALPTYAVNSDTAASVFLECLSGPAGALLGADSMHKTIEPIATRGPASISLNALRPYLNELGRRIEDRVRSVPRCMVATGTTATGVRRLKNGDWAVESEYAMAPIIASKVILASGGRHKAAVLQRFNPVAFGDVPLVCTSDDLLQGRMDTCIMNRLPKSARVCIVGASHSGFSAAWYLLQRYRDHLAAKSSIRIVGEAPPKVFFPNVTEAMAAGYTGYDANDVCPVTGRLFRLAGLRMDGRELYLRMLGLSAPVEHRVEFIAAPRNEQDPWMEGVDLVVDASGYHANVVRIRDVEGEPIELQGERTGHWVDGRCRLLDARGLPITGLYATGLATGFIPSGKLGGESSFTGQTNGLWYYQNIIGDILCNEITDAVPAHLP